jgi:hypothetical protein
VELRRELAPVSDSYLRRLLRESGIPVAQPYAGVRQGSFEELVQSLVEMEQVYRTAMDAGDRERARFCRRVVIQAKDHARMAARRSEARREEKLEMARWMLVWLENPAIFETWARLRLRGNGIRADGSLPE